MFTYTENKCILKKKHKGVNKNGWSTEFNVRKKDIVKMINAIHREDALVYLQIITKEILEELNNDCEVK